MRRKLIFIWMLLSSVIACSSSSNNGNGEEGCMDDGVCEVGSWCRENRCVDCNVNENCGPECTDCTANPIDKMCSRDGAECVEDNSCPDGFAGEVCDVCVSYVNAVADGGGDGVRWDTAFTSVQDAVGAAALVVETNGDVDVCEVWVVRGTYYTYNGNQDDTLQLQPHVEVYGGFYGTEFTRKSRDWKTNVSTLSGFDSASQVSRVYHVVTGSDNAVLDGFRITGGNADKHPPDNEGKRHVGGGMLNVGASPYVENCVFELNEAQGGGGMANHEGSSPTVKNCQFLSNSAINWEGGGMQNWGENSAPDVINTIFHNNTSGLSGAGGGMANVAQASPTITNCTFSRNATQWGSAEHGKAIHSENGVSTTVTNCILWGDVDDDVSGGGVEIYNVPGSGDVQPSTAEVTYSIVQGDTVYSGTGNANANPQFLSSVDLHLQKGSLAIDSGTSNGAPSDDLDGNPRPSGNGVDKGAYEYQD